MTQKKYPLVRDLDCDPEPDSDSDADPELFIEFVIAALCGAGQSRGF